MRGIRDAAIVADWDDETLADERRSELIDAVRVEMQSGGTAERLVEIARQDFGVRDATSSGPVPPV